MGAAAARLLFALAVEHLLEPPLDAVLLFFTLRSQLRDGLRFDLRRCLCRELCDGPGLRRLLRTVSRRRLFGRPLRFRFRRLFCGMLFRVCRRPLRLLRIGLPCAGRPIRRFCFEARRCLGRELRDRLRFGHSADLFSTNPFGAC